MDCLNTLPRRELSSGLAEVIKYGIILDAAFFAWLEVNLEALLALEPQALAYCIRRCCELKADVVAADEREQGQRALLQRAGLAVSGPAEMAPEDYLPHMMRDKKAIAGRLRLVLPVTLGNAQVRAGVADDMVVASIKDCQA